MRLGGRGGAALRFLGYWLGVVMLFGSIGAAAGQLVLPDDEEERPPPGPLVVGRQEVDPEGSPADEARRIARAFAQGEVTLFWDDFERSLPRSRLGLGVDQEELRRWIEAWRDPDSVMRRFRTTSGVRGPIAVPVPVRFDFDQASRALLTLKEELDREPSDAHIDLSKRRVIPEQIGRRLEVYATAADLEWSAREAAERVELSVVELPPRVRAEALERVDFDHVVGWFKTPYSQMHKHRHRTYNLTLAAKTLDGQILTSGEVFSFNDSVGERSEARGYRVAPVIAAGELVDGMGGGTCQIASTLHAAAFFAGLEIVEREPHSRPSSYIRAGLDATVSYPNIDLKLRNPFPHPVVIGMSVTDGWVRGEIRGPERELTVTYLRTLMETRDAPERVIEDSSMPLGVREVQQRGMPGLLIRRIRVFRRGTVQWRHLGVDRYPPTAHILRVGTNTALTPPEEPPEPPAPSSAPCNMRITQGPNDLFDEQTACQ